MCPDRIRFTTLDGVDCVAHFLSTWDNRGGRYTEQLDGLCHRQWGCAFELIHTIWEGRLDTVEELWHYVELKRIEQ